MVEEPRNGAPRVFGAPIPKVPAARPNTARTRSSAGYYSQTAASTGRRINVPVSRAGTSLSTHPRSNMASLRISHAGSPHITPREPASFAQPRSPIPRDSPSRIPVPAQLNQTPVQTITPNRFGFSHSTGTPASRPSSRQSRSLLGPSIPSPTARSHRLSHGHTNASVAIPTARRTATGIIDVNDIQASPRLTAEAKELAQKKLAAERDADARVDAFNAHILDMIRQGKEALGTTVEVCDDGGGVGNGGRWEDDDD